MEKSMWQIAATRHQFYLNKISIDTRRAQRAMDSVIANPNIPANLIFSSASGFLATELIQVENRFPMLVPMPYNANIAMAALIKRAASVDNITEPP
jgi:hypothetical protein